jgi:predicted ester cyclase
VNAGAHPRLRLRPPRRRGHRPEEAAELLHPFRTAFPDGGHTVHAVLASAPTVAVEGVWAGTHTGTFTTPQGDLAATGRRIEVPTASLATVDGDRLASVHIYTDQLAFMGQLGLTPAATSA